MKSPKRINSSKKSSADAFVYCVRMYGNGEVFIKVGFTLGKLETRFKSLPYGCTVLGKITVNNKHAKLYERAIHDMFQKYRYKPRRYFSGYTECYIMDAKDIILSRFFSER